MIWKYVNSSGALVEELDTEVNEFARMRFNGELILGIGRVEAVAVTDEEAGDCDCPGLQVSADGRPRYASRLNELYPTNESTNLIPAAA